MVKPWGSADAGLALLAVVVISADVGGGRHHGVVSRVDEEDERLRRAECAGLLQISKLEAWWRHKFGEFAVPAGVDDLGPYWCRAELYRWAVAAGSPRLLRAAPLDTWPDAMEPAGYLRAVILPGCVVQVWRTRTGIMGVLWALPAMRMDTPRKLFEALPHVDALVKVQNDFGIDGPGLSTTQRRGRHTGRWNDFGMRWRDLSRVLGQPAPYWLRGLRIPRLITEWQPAAVTVTYPTIPEVDTTPLLRLAATMAPDTPAHHALLHLVTITQHRSTQSAGFELDILNKTLTRMKLAEWPPEKTTTLAASPLDMPEPVDDEQLDLPRIRAGWLDILGRTDQLAADCVREAAGWDGGKYFPHASLEQVDPTGEFGAEWAARLVPVAQRKAVYWRLDDGEGTAFVDPECDAPVVRRQDGSYLVAVPQRLPTTEPLAEVILDDPVWIRTENGTLYPAPRNEYYGLSWGYGGSGPGSLALLIHRLLQDITAGGADDVNGAPDGLEELTQLAWPHGAVLTREVLEAARDGLPYVKPTSGEK